MKSTNLKLIALMIAILIVGEMFGYIVGIQSQKKTDESCETEKIIERPKLKVDIVITNESLSDTLFWRVGGQRFADMMVLPGQTFTAYR